MQAVAYAAGVSPNAYIAAAPGSLRLGTSSPRNGASSPTPGASSAEAAIGRISASGRGRQLSSPVQNPTGPTSTASTAAASNSSNRSRGRGRVTRLRHSRAGAAAM